MALTAVVLLLLLADTMGIAALLGPRLLPSVLLVIGVKLLLQLLLLLPLVLLLRLLLLILLLLPLAEVGCDAVGFIVGPDVRCLTRS